MTTYIIILATALFATTLGSISGIGGGVLIKPVMDAVSNLSASQISFLSGTTVLTMTIVSLIRSRKEKIDPRGIYLALGGAAGGLAGKQLFELVKASSSNAAFVSLVQNIIMVILTLSVFIYTLCKDKIRKRNITSPVASTLIGLFLGVLSSFLGIGGGPINIMFLSYFFSMDSKGAVLTSLYIIFFSQAVSFVSSMISGVGEVDWLLLLLMMIFAVFGATVGRALSKKMNNKAVDKLFLCLLALITLISIYNCFKFGRM